jgi:DNA-binding NarL/FixJ family response regulator
MKKEIIIIYETPAELTGFKNAFGQIAEKFTFHYASTAKEGLRLLRSKAIDLVFTKYHMSQKTGLFFLAVMRESNKFRRIKIYLYGEDISPEESEMARLLGATGCFQLEEDVNVFVHKLRAMLNPQLIPGYIFLTRQNPVDFSRILESGICREDSQTFYR